MTCAVRVRCSGDLTILSPGSAGASRTKPKKAAIRMAWSMRLKRGEKNRGGGTGAKTKETKNTEDGSF